MQWQPDMLIGNDSDVNQFRIVRKLADGHAGTIWLANKLRGERANAECVLKQIVGYTLTNDQLHERRSRQEHAVRIGAMFIARTNKAAGFENIMKIYGHGEWQGDPYLELEYIKGESLKERLAKRMSGLSQDEVLNLALQLCDALCFLESLPDRVIHRDITTSNIMLTPRSEATDSESFEIRQDRKDGQQTPLADRLVLIDFESALCDGDPPSEFPPDLHDPTNLRTYDIYLAAQVIAEMMTGKSIQDELEYRPPDVVLPGNDRLTKALRLALDVDPRKRPLSTVAFRKALATPQKANIRQRLQLLLRRRSIPQAVVSYDKMIPIPEGDFRYGVETPESTAHTDARHTLSGHEIRAKLIFQKGFYIDRTPVTNRQYLEFVRATQRQEVPFHDSPLARPYNWDRKEKRPPRGLEDHPVVLVSWTDAVAYAEWCNKRLPSEKEWEKAARGTKGWIYPWGNEWDPLKCNNLQLLGWKLSDKQDWEYFMKAVLFDLETWPKDAHEEPIPALATSVTRYDNGASPYGVLDMSGNIWEWTSDLMAEGRDRYVVRGGSWLEGPVGVRTTTRIGEWPKSRLPWIGFRCAASAPQER